ncbi:MAG: hypothetical protein WD894_05460 [Pirellulales bacterium]
MTKIVLDAATRARLADVVNCAELCDESGRPLGHFIPAVDPDLYRDVEIPFTEDELDAAEREPEAYTTAEVLRRLVDPQRGGAA